jgi:hypothetical protein
MRSLASQRPSAIRAQTVGGAAIRTNPTGHVATARGNPMSSVTAMDSARGNGQKRLFLRRSGRVAR